MNDPSAEKLNQETLSWLDSQSGPMLDLVIKLCNQNSGTFNTDGVADVADILQQEYESDGHTVVRESTPDAAMLNDRGETEAFALGPNLLVDVRSELQRKFFLCIHMDTVFDLEHSFQTCQKTEPGILNGPGVIDAKGGQVVMLYALRAFEQTEIAKQVGWRVFMNPDEEIGSLGSNDRLKALATDCELGLLFEPALPDGSMVAARKGSGNFTLVCRGKSAHSGRDFSEGRNAIVHLARCINEIDRLNQDEQTTFNVGRIQGGGPVNMVPDLAVARLNIRAADPKACREAIESVNTLVNKYNDYQDYQLTLDGHFSSPPKVVDAGSRRIQQVIETAANELGVPVSWRDTGGASDGNKLSGIGIPNIDTMGPTGNYLHSDKEFLIIDSLVQRAKLTASVLQKLALASALVQT